MKRSSARVMELGDEPAGGFGPNAIAIAKSVSDRRAVELAGTGGLRHLVQKDGVAFEAELSLAKLMVADPLAFLSDPVAATMSTGKPRGFGPGGGRALAEFDYSCLSDSKKGDFLAAFEAYLASVPQARRAREDALMAADELFTNGAKHEMSSRQDAIRAQVGRIRVRAAVDSERLALACVDSFGRLDVESPLRRIASCIDRGVATSIQQGPGGAGIGTFLVFNASASFSLAVEPGNATAVACSFALRRIRAGETIPKHLHILIVGR